MEKLANLYEASGKPEQAQKVGQKLQAIPPPKGGGGEGPLTSLVGNLRAEPL
jgi:hypothetical protein